MRKTKGEREGEKISNIVEGEGQNKNEKNVTVAFCAKDYFQGAISPRLCGEKQKRGIISV